MARRISTDVFRRTIVWNPRRNQNHQVLYCCSRTIGGLASRKLFSSTPPLTSSPSQILMETICPTTVTNTDGVNSASHDGSHTITKLTLNRPEAANAMGRQMISELQDCLDTLETRSVASCRCVVLTSSSERVFSAGADLKERALMTEDETNEFVTLLRTTMQRFAELPMPTIAAIDGVALGGGLELALASDLRIAARTARMGFPETSLAILPGAGGTQRLPRLIGASKAKQLIWTGTKLTGTEAFECGLVNEVVVHVDHDGSNTASTTTTTNTNTNTNTKSSFEFSAATAEQRAMDLAAAIASNGPVAIRASKVAIQTGGKLACMETALEIERECYSKVIPTLDRRNGLRAFREGKTPSYKGE